MAEYRAYILASDGRIMLPIELDCPDDEAALEASRKLVEGRDVELWQGKRKIEILRAAHKSQ